jgi:hypothetical protein
MTTVFVAELPPGVVVTPVALVETASARAWKPSTVWVLVLKTFPEETRERAARVAWCESRFRHRARNRWSGAAGVYQFLPSTWRGRWNPWRARDVYDPQYNVWAAYVLSRGGTNWDHWSC